MKIAWNPASPKSAPLQEEAICCGRVMSSRDTWCFTPGAMLDNWMSLSVQFLILALLLLKIPVGLLDLLQWV